MYDDSIENELRELLNEDAEEGSLEMSILICDGSIVMTFAKPIAWVSMSATTATKLGKALCERADFLLENTTGEN